MGLSNAIGTDCDPPYIDRYADYYNGWTDNDEAGLHSRIASPASSFIIATWHHNDFRRNVHLDRLWDGCQVLTRKHFYHVGASENNRHAMVEALITNIAQGSIPMMEESGNEQCPLFA